MYFPKYKNEFVKTPSEWIIALSIFALISFGCFSGCEKAHSGTTIDDILKAGEITVITRNNAHCYYQYREQAMGFEHDLAQAFADYLGVRLQLKIAEDWEGMIPALLNGSGAFIAASMTITPKRQKQVAFSNGYKEIQQFIIIHRNNLSINKAEDLAGKAVHVRRGTSYQERLEALHEQGIDLKIKLHDNLPTQELIRQVAKKNIEVTIADSNIALLNRRYYPQTIMAGPINKKEYLGWAVNRNAHRLLERINSFFKEIKANGKFAEIYNRYYADVAIFDYFDLKTYHKRLITKLPLYKPVIEEAANEHGFDWRLIAAQMYQESHFDPEAESHAGAFGLMQLTNNTAESLGVKNILQPEENIRAGVKHLKNLYDFYNNANGSDRLFIALAAYNIGLGHILDARNIARKKNIDPNKWSSISKTLPLLRFRKYYKDSLYGYCRGTEPIEYIKQIMIYYDILKQQGVEYTIVTLSRQQELLIDY